ncbi:hypothetical protein Q3G72_017622 [Acer saccharum]|nr:hypothetical protein Q3G72_017622 [Acer saccharum]
MESLKELLLDNTAMAKLPQSVILLVKLEKLNLSGCFFLKELPQSIGKLVSLKEFSLDHSAIEELPDSVGYLGNLEKLSLFGCSAVTAIPGSVGNLRSLTEFLIDGAAVKELPPTIGQLSYLKTFSVSNCRFLIKLPESIERLASIVELQLNGLSITENGLKMVDKFEMRNCSSLRKLPESIGSMPRVLEFLEKALHEWLQILAYSGSEETFQIIFVNNEIPDDLRYQIPAVADIHAKILAQNKTRLTSALNLLGVPKTNQDHVHLCRYPAYHPLVSMLKDGYKIQVVLQNPPFLKGVEIKKCGIYLVFENDDDYDGDEESLDENQQSVSAKLAKIFGSLEDEH